MSQKRLVEIAIKAKDETRGAFASLERSLGSGGAKFAMFAASAAAIATAVVAATNKLYDFTAEMARAGDQLEKMSQRTDVAVEKLSELGFALQRGGGDIGDLETGLRRLSRAMGDAQRGTEKQVEAFSRLGISVADLSGPDGELRSFDSLLPQIADGIKALGSQAQRIDIAQELFGRGGTALLPMLQEGAAGIARMRAEMEKYGGAMSTQFADKSAQFADSQTNLANATQRLKEALAEPFLGPFTSAVNLLASTVADGLREMGLAGNKTVGGLIGPAPTPEQLRMAEAYAIAAATGQNVQDVLDPLPPRPNPTISTPKDWRIDLGDGTEAFLGAQMDEFDKAKSLYQSVMDGMIDGTGDLTQGFSLLVPEIERMSYALEFQRSILPNLTSSLDSAFYTALTSTQSFGRAFVDALRRTFADTLASIGSRAISGVIGNLVPGLNLADKASGSTKGLPGASTMFANGRMVSMASNTYGRGFLS